MVLVEYKVYIQDLGMFDDDGGELEWQETIGYEYATREQAEREADKDKEGWAGTYVEVYIDGSFYRDYEA